MPTKKTTSKPGKKIAKRASATVAPLTEHDKEFVLRFLDAQIEARREGRLPVCFENMAEPGAPISLERPAGMDEMLWRAQLAATTGMTSGAAQIAIVTRLSTIGSPQNPDTVAELNKNLAILREIGPRDGLEGLIAAQMVAVHSAAKVNLCRAMNPEQSIENSNHATGNAVRLLRLFAVQMETLARYRGKGPSEQVVRVEHVNVHAGGQAVVGNVTTAVPGVGGENSNA